MAEVTHPYFRKKDPPHKSKSYTREPNETMDDVLKKAREWIISQAGKIEIIGSAWSKVPVMEESKRGPSSFNDVYTISYTEKETGG